MPDESIVSFEGPWAFLSNYWPCLVTLEGIVYPSLEHAYQAAKVDALTMRATIRDCVTPDAAKRLARSVGPRPGWENAKVAVMTALVRDKFTRDARLGGLLLATGTRYLVEGNDWGDRFWGVCRGGGQNHLGEIIMTIRAELRSVRQRHLVSDRKS